MITEEFIGSIQTRSQMLANRYYFLEKEDLMQEGYILLLGLDKKEMPPLQVHKAINNMYSNIERHAQYQQRIEQNTSSFEIDPEEVYPEDNADEILERENITQKLLEKLSPREIVIVEWLSRGLNLDEIADIMRVGRDRIRRMVNNIIKKRKEIENVL